MYIVSLDEYGDFEKKEEKYYENNSYQKKEKYVERASLIGGIIFDDKGITSEIKHELSRIRAYYEQITKEVAEEVAGRIDWIISFPHIFHCKRTKDIEEKEIQDELVRRAKKKVTATISEFMQNGTYQGETIKSDNGKIPPRKGEYRIYAVFKSDVGVSKRNVDNTNTFLSDSFASNLYINMASSVIDRVVFNNPYTGNKPIFSLELATRVTADLKMKGELARQYRQHGYNEPNVVNIKNKDDEGENGKTFFKVTDKDVYRMIISNYVKNNNPLDAAVKKCVVKSINYSVDRKEAKNNGFLYMADSVCSVLSYGLEKNRKFSESRFNELYKRACKILPEDKLLIFAYDDIDEDFKVALNCYLNNNYYEALKVSYKCGNKKGKFAKFYKEKWFTFIEKMVVSSMNVNAFRNLVADYSNSQYSNTYDQLMGLYILTIIEKLGNNIKPYIKTVESQSIYATLYEAAMVSYCHMGDSKNAEKYYKKILQYAYTIKVEDLIRIRDMLCVCYSDSFEWNKALKLARKNVKVQSALSDIKRNIIDKKYYEGFLGEAKSLSQSGQLYAFCRDSHAEKYFINSLNIVKEKSANYYITMSYLLHYYIDQNMEEKYKSLAYEYFGNKEDLEEQLDYIFEEGLSEDPFLNVKFALYVYIKALYLFNKDKITDSLWDKISKIEVYVNEEYKCFNGTWKLDGHPTELIKKYVVLIAIDRGDVKTAKKNKDTLIKMVDESDTIVNFITWLSVIDICRMQGDTRSDDMILEIADKLSNTYESFASLKDIKNTSEIYKILKNYFTYMYC